MITILYNKPYLSTVIYLRTLWHGKKQEERARWEKRQIDRVIWTEFLNKTPQRGGARETSKITDLRWIFGRSIAAQVPVLVPGLHVQQVPNTGRAYHRTAVPEDDGVLRVDGAGNECSCERAARHVLISHHHSDAVSSGLAYSKLNPSLISAVGIRRWT